MTAPARPSVLSWAALLLALYSLGNFGFLISQFSPIWALLPDPLLQLGCAPWLLLLFMGLAGAYGVFQLQKWGAFLSIVISAAAIGQHGQELYQFLSQLSYQSAPFLPVSWIVDDTLSVLVNVVILVLLCLPSSRQVLFPKRSLPSSEMP